MKTNVACGMHFVWPVVRGAPCDFVAIAELKIINSKEHELVIRNNMGSLKELEAYGQHAEGGQLLPLKYDDRLYE